MPTLYFGIANVIANGLIMLRYEPSPQITRLFLIHSAPLSSGFLRIWKMITHIIWLYEHSASGLYGLLRRVGRVIRLPTVVFRTCKSRTRSSIWVSFQSTQIYTLAYRFTRCKCRSSSAYDATWVAKKVRITR